MGVADIPQGWTFPQRTFYLEDKGRDGSVSYRYFSLHPAGSFEAARAGWRVADRDSIDPWDIWPWNPDWWDWEAEPDEMRWKRHRAARLVADMWSAGDVPRGVRGYCYQSPWNHERLVPANARNTSGRPICADCAIEEADAAFVAADTARDAIRHYMDGRRYDLGPLGRSVALAAKQNDAPLLDYARWLVEYRAREFDFLIGLDRPQGRPRKVA